MNWFAVKYFPIEQDLTALTQFLNDKGIQHLITEERGQQVLAVADLNIVPALEQFLENYQQGRVELPVVKSAGFSNAEMDGLAFVHQLQATPVVFVLIILSGLGALLVNTHLGNMWLGYFTFQALNDAGFIPVQETLMRGEIWRLLTPVFLHFGAIHFIFNALGVWILGRCLENFMGHWQFIFFTLGCALVSNLAQYLASPGLFGGISGVIYAFVGFIVISQRLNAQLFIEIPKVFTGFMLFWLVLCLTGVVDFFIAGGIGNGAHVGGLVAGGIYALLNATSLKSRKQ